MNEFTCFSVSPIALAHPGLAVATVRAGGVGILDREFCGEQSLELANKNLNQLLDLIDREQSVGLRLSTAQIATSGSLLERLSQHPHWIVIAQWHPKMLGRAVASLPTSTSRKLLLEVTDVEQISALEVLSVPIAGIVARGNESGGWGGDDPAFILSQKILGRKPSHPVYVQGGIGFHTAAACRAAGAAGVILDDQLWLMPESPLPEAWQEHLRHLSGQEAIAIGERINAPVRVLSRPGFKAIPQLQTKVEQLEQGNGNGGASRWRNEAEQLLGWESPGIKAWPMGQAVGLAVAARERYQTTGRFIQSLLKASTQQLELAKQLRPMAANSPLALSHRTQYPIVQGPMTRVSDTAEFAAAVSAGGGLPLIALALMRQEEVKNLLYKTKELLGERSWGVGILGFVPQALREEQLKVVKDVKPSFALIAGGRPDQAAQLEQIGIATYIHVPTPSLLAMFLEQGAKRFVLEGRECGGHVGPLNSFTLWESAIATLLEKVPPGAQADIHILFAGGIHDALSAAMVSVMAAPLVERGMKIGVLMGTAYLFTQEAVSCGAIVEGFQQQAVACTRTLNLETGPGHASRCALTPFAQEFDRTRRRLVTEGATAEDIKITLEDLTLGRLRIASKGLVRQGAEIHFCDPQQQLTNGMYMIGQVATLRNQVVSIKELHQNVAETSTQLLANLELNTDTQESETSTPSDIAMIGIGTLLPRAQKPDTFWENILQKVSAITEIPQERWDWRLYYSPDRHAKDKVYSKWGGFLEDVPFDPLRFGIPPKSLKSIEPMQLMTLEAVRRALADAGYENVEFDQENTSVILGASGGMSDLGQQYATRSEIPRMVANPDSETWDRLPEWTEESFPGLLFNVTAGRVANRFDLGGSNYTVDAACASSLAAVNAAVSELVSGRSNLAIAGGVDTVQSAFAYYCFSKTQALSPQGVVRSFDQSADGIAISEGIAVIALKRLADAQRDGDRIYAVIKAVAGSSDGKGLSLTAPASSGQKRAFNRAYRQAGFSPSTIGFYEAHGTGTVAGDRAELETIQSVLQENSATAKSCAIGSVKTLIGHTKSTAGIAALIKAALSLHYQVLPPHSNVDHPLEPLSADDSPLYLLKEPKAWLRHPDYPRRAGVSAFGFGGTNFHAVLEEYQGDCHSPSPGAKAWPCELLVLLAPTREALVKQVATLQDSLRQGAKPKLRDLAYSYAGQAKTNSHHPFGLSLVVENLQQLTEALETVLAHLKGETSTPLPLNIQIKLVESNEPKRIDNGRSQPPKIAFLFPGQVAQYPGMAQEVAVYFQEMREALALADLQMRPFFPQRLSHYIHPPSAYSEAAENHAKEQLTETHIAQPAIGAVEIGYLDLAARLGLKPDMVGGHSYGEYTALYAAGVLSRSELLRLSEVRGRVMSAACEASDGAMAAVKATRKELLARLEGLEDVVIANHNAPLQSVISGKTQVVQQVVERLQVAQIMAQMLPVAGAFHSSLVESAQISLTNAISAAVMQPPKIPIYSNTTGRPYNSDVEAIRHQLCRHLLSPVEFVDQINAMYEAGARIFIEVGPKRILSRLVEQIMTGREHLVVSLDGKGRGLSGLLNTLGTLAIHGVEMNLTELFAGRDVQQIDLSQILASTKESALSETTWLVNGGSARPQTAAIGFMGKVPPLNQDTAAKLQNSHKDNAQFNLVAEQPPLAPTPASSKSVVNRSATMVSQPIEPQPTASTPRQTIPADTALIAYQAYQETMRQFLRLQEQVMTQFLSRDFSGTASGTVPVVTPTTGSLATVPKVTPRLHHETVSVAAGNGHSAIAPSIPKSTPNLEVIPIPSKAIHPEPMPVLNEESPQTTVAEPSYTPIDRPTLTKMLLNLVSDRTGYPPDMLGLDQDMEAELGIDSIKRVEILGAFQRSLPEPLASALKGEMERFTQIKTLNGLLDLVIQNASAGSADMNAHAPQLATVSSLGK